MEEMRTISIIVLVEKSRHIKFMAEIEEIIKEKFGYEVDIHSKQANKQNRFYPKKNEMGH